jgi:hypothetical protein
VPVVHEIVSKFLFCNAEPFKRSVSERSLPSLKAMHCSVRESTSELYCSEMTQLIRDRIDQIDTTFEKSKNLDRFPFY